MIRGRTEWVFVTDAEERAALAAARGLDRAGYSVAAGANRTPASTHWSRSCRERHRLPDPRRDGELFVERLEEIVAGRSFAAIVPGGEAALLAISANRDGLEALAPVGLPPHDRVLRSLDKVLLVETASDAGLPSPASVVCTKIEEVADGAGELGFPLLVKPSRSYVARDGRLEQHRSVIAPNLAAAERAANTVGLPCVLQRFEPEAHVVSCGGVTAGGRLHGLVTARFGRTWPVRNGAASFAETVPNPPGLEVKIEKLLGATGWEGIFEVEFLNVGGKLHTIDLNPRVFGWLALAVHAGANLPAIWVDVLQGRDDGGANARAGVRYRWEDGDAANALWQLGRGNVRATAAALRPRRGVVHAFFRATDPGPIAARLVYIGRRGVERVRGRG